MEVSNSYNRREVHEDEGTCFESSCNRTEGLKIVGKKSMVIGIGIIIGYLIGDYLGLKKII